MLLRPRRPIPRRFARAVSKETRAFVSSRNRRLRERRRAQWIRGFRRIQHRIYEWRVRVSRLALLGILVLLFFAFGLILFSPILQVREIRVERRNPRLDPEAIQCALSPLFRRRLFFLSSHDVRNLLTLVVSDADTVSVRKEYPSTIRVRVELDPLVARLEIDGLKKIVGTGAVMKTPEPSPCGKPNVPPPQDAQMFLTAEGRAVIPLASTETGSILPLIHLADWGVRPAHGEILFTPEIFTRLKEIEQALLQHFSWRVVKRTVYVRAREIHVETDRGFALWFDLRPPLQVQIMRLRLFLREVGVSTVKKYIDLRLGGRVIYR